jgi:chaperonin GroEL (HSP60 family)
VDNVLLPALQEPLFKLLDNCGYSQEEASEVFDALYKFIHEGDEYIYDALDGEFVKFTEAGVVDSLPAVLEALRNSISVASLLGTLGGVVVFPRDTELERQEAQETLEFLRDANAEEA